MDLVVVPTLDTHTRAALADWRGYIDRLMQVGPHICDTAEQAAADRHDPTLYQSAAVTIDAVFERWATSSAQAQA
jgi:hypothetical protein